MGPGLGNYGHGLAPDPQAWEDMTPEKDRQWRRMRARLMRDTLPLRQELSAKQMELVALWDQPDPDSEKIKALSERNTELRSELDQKHDTFLSQCRQKFGYRGWVCPAGRGKGY